MESFCWSYDVNKSLIQAYNCLLRLRILQSTKKILTPWLQLIESYSSMMVISLILTKTLSVTTIQIQGLKSTIWNENCKLQRIQWYKSLRLAGSLELRIIQYYHIYEYCLSTPWDFDRYNCSKKKITSLRDLQLFEISSSLKLYNFFES